MRRVGRIVLAMSLAFMFVGSAMSWDGGKRVRKDRVERIRQWMSQLGLNEEQKQKVRQLFSQHRQNLKKLREETHKLWQELQSKLNEGSDERELNPIITDIVKVYAKIIREKVHYSVQMRQVLTPEQFKRWQEIQKRRHSRGKVKPVAVK